MSTTVSFSLQTAMRCLEMQVTATSNGGRLTFISAHIVTNRLIVSVVSAPVPVTSVYPVTKVTFLANVFSISELGLTMLLLDQTSLEHTA